VIVPLRGLPVALAPTVKLTLVPPIPTPAELTVIHDSSLAVASQDGD